MAIALSKIEQVQAKINQFQDGIQQAQAQVNQTQADLDYGVVKAPFAGVVTRKYTEVGALAGEGESLVTIESDRNSRLLVEIPASLKQRVQLGQLLPIQLNSLEKEVPGRVNKIVTLICYVN